MGEPIIDLLEEVWRVSAELGADLNDEEWQTPTDLPGWTVKDCYSHVAGTERAIRGEPMPEVSLEGLDHLTAPSSIVTEPAVAFRRDRPGADVLAEFREVTAERVDELRSMTPEQWDEVTPGPTGQAPYREFMNIRAFDCWMHEQDVRRALGRPGHQDGPVAAHALWRCELAAGFVVGKKAGAPDGSSVVFDLTGPLARQIAVVVEGRAQVVEEAPSDPTVTLTMDQETYWCLGGGRWDPEEVLADAKVAITGDRSLGEAVVRASNFMI